MTNSRLIFNIVFGVFSIAFIAYLLKPSPPFPGATFDSVQSVEPGDTETTLRRAYFTNFTRSQVIAHYETQFSFLPVLRLNYPPEDAQTLVRDQTRSTYLEELVHPFREGVFVNGFEPREAKDEIWYKGVRYGQKVTIKMVPSTIQTRLFIGALTMFSGYLVFNEWGKFVSNVSWRRQ